MINDFLIHVEIQNGSEEDYKLLRKHLKHNGFKRRVSSKGDYWKLPDKKHNRNQEYDLPKVYNYVTGVIEKINKCKVRITTDLKAPDNLLKNV